MPEEQITVSPPVDQQVPLAPEKPTPPPEVVDERGVPIKNVKAEYERKLAAQQEVISQYQIIVGQQQAQAQPQPTPRRKPQEMFDEETLTGINLLVEQRANEIMHRAQISQQLNDPELNTAAREEYTAVINNPIYADWPETAKQSYAVAQAKTKLLERKQQSATQQATQQVLQNAAQVQAAGASLPGTGGGGQVPGDEKARFIKKFIEDPYQQQNFRSMYRGIDINSQEAQERLKRVAEKAWASKTQYFHKEGEPESRVHYEERG